MHEWEEGKENQLNRLWKILLVKNYRTAAVTDATVDVLDMPEYIEPTQYVDLINEWTTMAINKVNLSLTYPLPSP